MGANPIPLYWQGELAIGTIQRVVLPNTGGLFTQAIIINVDNGDIQISNMNFVKIKRFRQMDGTVNLTQRQFVTVQNQYVFSFFHGIVLVDDIELTLFENSGVATEVSISVIPARRNITTQFATPDPIRRIAQTPEFPEG